LISISRKLWLILKVLRIRSIVFKIKMIFVKICPLLSGIVTFKCKFYLWDLYQCFLIFLDVFIFFFKGFLLKFWLSFFIINYIIFLFIKVTESIPICRIFLCENAHALARLYSVQLIYFQIVSLILLSNFNCGLTISIFFKLIILANLFVQFNLSIRFF
jgi:hypothetical protein